MTDAELHDAIVANPTAKAFADVGNDSGCAAVIAATLPPVPVYKLIDASNILAAFADPAEGLTVVGTIKAVAAGNSTMAPVVAEVLPWLTTPGSPGLNAGSDALRAMLDAFVAAGALTPTQVATIKAIAEVPAVITADQVSAAMRADRIANGENA